MEKEERELSAINPAETERPPELVTGFMGPPKRGVVWWSSPKKEKGERGKKKKRRLFHDQVLGGAIPEGGSGRQGPSERNSIAGKAGRRYSLRFGCQKPGENAAISPLGQEGR